jgi:hypothetical protein
MAHPALKGDKDHEDVREPDLRISMLVKLVRRPRRWPDEETIDSRRPVGAVYSTVDSISE